MADDCASIPSVSPFAAYREKQRIARRITRHGWDPERAASTPACPTRADHALEMARREAADALRAGLDACEATRAQLAAGIDCSPARLAQYVDPGDDATICVARAALLPDPARVALAQHVAGERFALVELPHVETGREAIVEALAAQRETSEALAAHLVAIADGIVTRDEGARLVREVDEAIRELLRLRALGEAAVREGVVGVEETVARRATTREVLATVPVEEGGWPRMTISEAARIQVRDIQRRPHPISRCFVSTVW